MLTMKRLPNDSFLPSGGIDSFDRSISQFPHLNGHSNSTISPLSLAQSISQPYFDIPRSNHASPSSPPATQGPRQYLSPDYNSLSTPTRGSPGAIIASPLIEPINSGTMSPFEHLSPQAAATLLQRRDDHNRRLRECWEAERTHLEASRARAEEMFREERTLMDEERLIWAEQKAELENEILKWKQNKEAAEAEVLKLTELLKSKSTSNGHAKFGRALDGAADDVLGSQGHGNTAGPKLGGTSSSTFQTPSDGISPSSLPPGRSSTIPKSNPFEPLDPRMQSASPTNPPTSKEKERVPSIEINEIMPGLEGVRLKAPAVQKSTFDDRNQRSSTSATSRIFSPDTKKCVFEVQSYVSPAVMTQETLKAPEHHRLTMHAGHTPNHSMSFSNLPTIESTAGNTAGSTGTCTPTTSSDPQRVHGNDTLGQGRVETIAGADQDETAISGAVIYEPSDDPALKGPLCLKNRPAADEVFLRRLSDKLEEVKATEATPSVLNELITRAPTEDQADLKAGRLTEDEIIDRESEDTLEEVEEDVPLKLKASSNFGQPLGQVRRTSGF
ncbi:hypothetical protein F5B22DRAFT_660469 [Xylaria bambusicola]|uniref:uncharacterized protein n=1 Tax=Xylaria bambusicola TaxID=326684 RepID=UPI002008C0BF|nr:uncharacterized protein F5B22DRAFT_660469 [Xylaria bambusicola]KAI0522106.1 hypothetical protein F5B22DRAFT_660469 [Xylaria bambusicola]